jgi:hypothetical protein
MCQPTRYPTANATAADRRGHDPRAEIGYSMLDLNTGSALSYQPQVFSLFGIPEAAIDSEVLSSKTISLSRLFSSDDEKIEIVDEVFDGGGLSHLRSIAIRM